MKVKALLRFFLGVPLTIISFLFIAKIFFDNRELISHNLVLINPLLLILGIFFFTSFFAIKSFIWLQILKKRGYVLPVRTTLFKYSLSEARRYVPGSILSFVSRINSHQNELPKKETLKGIGIEALLLVISAFLASIPAFLFLISKYNSQLPNYISPILITVFLLFIGFIMLQKKIRDVFIKYFDSYILFVLSWYLYALGCFFTALSFTFIDPNNLVIILSLFIVAWLSGYLFFITPMGLGVRELVVIFGLSFFVSTPNAVVIALISRLAMILGEMLFLLVTFSVSRLNKSSQLLRLNPYFLIVIIFSILYFSFFTYYSVLKHDRFLTGRFDLGNMTQTVWNTSRGNFFTLTNPDGVYEISRLGIHSDYLLVTLAPLYLIWDSPKVLLTFQSFSLALAGIFVYLFARRVLKHEILAVVFSASYYLNFWIHEQNLFDFHAVSVATLFLLGAIYFLQTKNYKFTGFFLILSALCKENVFLVISFFGLEFIKCKKWILGAVFMILSILAFFYLSSVAIPNARGEAHFALGTYSYLGDSVPSILKNSLLSPSLLINQLFNHSTLMFIHHHMLSTGYLSIISPFYLLFTLPEAAIYLLSDNFEYRSYQYHFGALIIPFVYASSIFSTKFLINKFKNIQLAKILTIYLIIVTLYAFYNYSPVPGTKNGDTTPFKVKSSEKISKYISVIPSGDSVSASNNIGAHLSHRKTIYVVPFGIDKANYIVLHNEKESLKSLINSNEYEIIKEDKELNFYIYKKRIRLTCQTCNP